MQPRKGSNFAAQLSGAIVQKPEGTNTYYLKNLAIAIWQPCLLGVPRQVVQLGQGPGVAGVEADHPVVYKW